MFGVEVVFSLQLVGGNCEGQFLNSNKGGDFGQYWEYNFEN